MKLRTISLVLVLLASCSEGEPPVMIGEVEGYLCDRDPNLLAERLDCLSDDDCPCGSYCNLGTCGYACSTDSECGTDQRCDSFGRCRLSGDGSLLPPPTGEAEGRLVIDPLGLALEPGRSTGVFTVAVAGAGAGAVRIEAPEGAEIACGEGAFAGDCLIDSLDSGAPSSVRVRVTREAPAEAELVEVRVISESSFATVNIRWSPPAVDPTAPLEGLYRGHAVLETAGLTSSSVPLEVAPDLSALRVPIEATVHADGGGVRVVELRDALGIVFGGREAIATLAGTGSALAFELPRRLYLGPDVPAPGDLAVTIAGAPAPVSRGQGALVIPFIAVFEGALTAQHRPELAWRILLERAGDLPSDAVAPPVPAAHEPVTRIDRAGTELPIETAAAVEHQAVRAALAGGAPADIAAATICSPFDASAPVALGDQIALAWSGDLACADDSPQRTIGLYASQGWEIAPRVASCLEDLAALADARAGVGPALGDRSCLDGGRLIAALGVALDPDRRRALGEAIPPAPRETTIALRLL